jgi:hypothetical protein
VGVVGIADSTNAELILALETLVLHARTGKLIGLLGVAQFADGDTEQVTEGLVLWPDRMIGQLHILASQQALIEAQDNLDEDDDS